MSTRRLLLSTLVVSLALTACQKDKGHDVNKAADKLDGPYDAAISDSTKLVISDARVVAIKTLTKDEAANVTPATDDGKRDLFVSTLYPKLQSHCGQCHAGQNDFPFASPGLDLAWTTAQRYMTADPEQSKMIQNIRASHNGVDPTWADELRPMITELASP